jgi:hypothetical protein
MVRRRKKRQLCESKDLLLSAVDFFFFNRVFISFCCRSRALAPWKVGRRIWRIRREKMSSREQITEMSGGSR